MKYLLVFVLCLIAGCASFDGTGPSGGPAGNSRTFAAPIARVKPAAVYTIAQMGRVVLNAGASYDAAGTARFIQQTEKALAAS